MFLMIIKTHLLFVMNNGYVVAHLILSKVMKCERLHHSVEGGISVVNLVALSIVLTNFIAVLAIILYISKLKIKFVSNLLKLLSGTCVRLSYLCMTKTVYAMWTT